MNENPAAIDQATCALCGAMKPRQELIPVAMLRPALSRLVRQAQPECPAQAFICLDDFNRLSADYVESVLAQERGELTALERDVARSLEEQELLSRNLNAHFDEKLSLGDRLSDRVAEFGGSWAFILSFVGVLVLWILCNAVLLTKPFDPFPFILLNLVLSCVAALQAPVIMMSQNRQEAKDRLRAENDYRTNLKAELEIRHLHEKIDYLLLHQWQRLLEIQELQLELMEELGRAQNGKQNDNTAP